MASDIMGSFMMWIYIADMLKGIDDMNFTCILFFIKFGKK